MAEARAKDERDRDQWREEQLSARFQDAAKQLGDLSPAIRLAGVYAMARLADDWVEQRQVCVDVLCGYLRLPRKPDDRAGDQVRQSILRTLSDRTRPSDSNRSTSAKWPDLNINLSGAILRDLKLDLTDVTELNLNGAQLSGETDLSNSPTGGIDVRNVHISGRASLLSVHLPYDRSDGIVVDDGDVRWVPQDPVLEDLSSMILLADLTVKKGRLKVDIESYREGGSVVLSRLHIHQDGQFCVHQDGQFCVQTRALTQGPPFTGCVAIEESDVAGQIVLEGDIAQSTTNEIDPALEEKVLVTRGSPF